MDNNYDKEQQVVAMAEKLLGSYLFQSKEDELQYRLLYDEYKILLKQMMKAAQLSDLLKLELEKMSKEIEAASQVDALTGLYNKKYFSAVFQREWKSAIRSGGSIALIKIDIDYFKKYNDTYGQMQGDFCLKKIAELLRYLVNRPRDVVVRYGEDEFILLLPETGIVGAAVLSEEILAGIELLTLDRGSAAIQEKITASMGIAAISPKEETAMDMLLQEVDQALFQAKKGGRNCFRFYNSSMILPD